MTENEIPEATEEAPSEGIENYPIKLFSRLKSVGRYAFWLPHPSRKFIVPLCRVFALDAHDDDPIMDVTLALDDLVTLAEGLLSIVDIDTKRLTEVDKETSIDLPPNALEKFEQELEAIKNITGEIQATLKKLHFARADEMEGHWAKDD